MPAPLTTLRLALRDIKLAHSVFSMPFAILAASMALPDGTTAARIAALLGLVCMCMFFARTWAMLVNRIADARFDAENPRTAQRAIASGKLSQRGARGVAAIVAMLFILSTFGFFALDANPWPATLSAPVLLWIAFYSFTKRFTAAAHFFLGGALAISPIAAVIAIDPSHLGLSVPIGMVIGDITSTGISVLSLAGFVLLWVAGFDIAYALQDLDFDRIASLHSIPARLGVSGSLWVSRLVHLGALACLAIAIRTEPRFGTIMFIAFGLVGVVLIMEHAVLHRRDLAGLPLAFFTLNGIISITLGILGVIDLFL